MSSMDAKLAELRRSAAHGYWGERILSQLEYAVKLSKVKDNRYDGQIESTVAYLSRKFSEENAITREAAVLAENEIRGLSQEAKAFKMICAAHAHIDMNWMWRWDETVAITLETFRTMLDLMEEYPDFKFSQSQASVYRIVEEYAPDMLEEIKKRVKEGRWEVTASTWVETDKNMPNGESLSRHILYTKKYLSELLDIDPDTLNIDFEPDTFGHSVNVPEIMNAGGVKYYYHCRGYEGHHLYRWTAPSGSSVTVYREPVWYNASIEPSMASYVPEFCTSHGMDTMLKVYGVGDHGGGPTRRDIERILDMSTWPVFPQIRFGTFGEYFALLEPIAENLPEVHGELNFVFSGCYTTQTRIKLANRVGEAALDEAEAFSAVASLCSGYRYSAEAFAEAWKNVLFNHFHDIIPGSGIIDTREYAMGLFQKTLAIANSSKLQALRSIVSKIDTTGLVPMEEGIKDTISEGAGVGYGVKDFKITATDRGRGKTRIFHFFNPSCADREEVAEVVVWDWKGDTGRILFQDSEGVETDFQVLDQGFHHYWGHDFLRVLLKARVPALGYSTYTMTENVNYTAVSHFPLDPRVELPETFLLENAFIKVTLDSQSASIRSLVDKSSGMDYLAGKQPAGIFRLIREDTSKGMTAWIVGRYMDITNLTGNVKITKAAYNATSLRQSVTYEIAFGASRLKAEVSLDYNRSGVDFAVECDWHEIGKPETAIPQLNFYLPVGYDCRAFKYDVPFGVTERAALDMDVPGNSWVLGVNENPGGKSLMLATDSKYGFRGWENAMSITLIRSSYDPDPYPELGVHHFRFSINLVEEGKNNELIAFAHAWNHPVNVLTDKPHKGSLPVNMSFIRLLEGSVAVSSVKLSEEGTGGKKLLLRLYETDGIQTQAVFQVFRKPARVGFLDGNEKELETVSKATIVDDKITIEVLPYTVNNICIEF
jgi:alpha-mannosidase